jgi:hypothetical protein
MVLSGLVSNYKISHNRKQEGLRNSKIFSLRIANIPAKIRIGNLSIINWKRYTFRQLIRYQNLQRCAEFQLAFCLSCVVLFFNDALKDVDWIYVAYYGEHGRALGNFVMNLRVV